MATSAVHGGGDGGYESWHGNRKYGGHNTNAVPQAKP